MKHLSRTQTFLSLLTLLSLGATAHAQGSTRQLPSQQLALTKAGEALDHVVLTAKKVNQKLGYGFYEGGCVFGVMLRPGNSTSESFSLNVGQSFVFIGGGDNSTRNVDILVRDSAGNIVGKDTEADASPFVLFKPKRSGRYTMSVKLTSSRNGTAFCAITVLRKGGYDVPIERIGQAVAKAAVLSALVFRGVNGGRFNQDQNNWALFGAVLPPKGSISNDPKPLRSAHRVFMGVGDNNIQDLDVVLLDAHQKPVAADTKNGQAAALAFTTSQKSYSVGLLNNSSNGPSLVMALSMELPAGYKMPATASGQNRVGRTAPARGAHPFVGSWDGDWSDDANNQEGEFAMMVRADGSLTGEVSNTTAGMKSPVTGFINPNGALAFVYSYQGRNYAASGTIKSVQSDQDDPEIRGNVTFRSNGQPFGTGDFTLYKNN